jgi:hypothetical protein
VPLTSDPALFVEAVTIGRRLLRLQTFGERFTEADGAAGGIPRADGAGWAKAVTTMPATTADITYDASRQTIVIGDGEITGVRPDVWAFSVSGMQVLPKWLGYRTRKGTGRAATQPKPLDLIRPESWVDDWNDELIDLVSILTATVDLQTAQADLLDRIVAGPLVAASDLPEPTASERKPPKVG